MTVHHGPELGPVDLAKVPVAPRFVPLQVRIRRGHAEHVGLRNRGVHELLAQVVVGDALDAPLAALRPVLRFAVVRAKHHERGPPPAVDGVLHHVALRLGAAHHRQQQVEALALVEALLLADADHGARIGSVRAARERDLVHDRRAVDQPADHADVGPRKRRVVEDGRVLGLAGVQGFDQIVARHAQGLRRGVQVQAVTAFVLHLGEQDGLALERGRARDPVALRQHADDLGVRVLRDLPHQGLAVRLRHPVLGLDEFTPREPGVELGLVGGILNRVGPAFWSSDGWFGRSIACVYIGYLLSPWAGGRRRAWPCRP